MKIYFEDGPLLKQTSLAFKYDFSIDAKNGYSFCNDRLETALYFHPECTIYTNSLIALNGKYAWNEELGVHEIYMRDGEHQVFHRIDKLTQRELRQHHNIMKMYIANEFRNLVSGAV